MRFDTASQQVVWVLKSISAAHHSVRLGRLVDAAAFGLICFFRFAGLQAALLGHAVVVYFVEVNFDDPVPAAGYNSVVRASVANEGYFALLRVVGVKSEDVDARNDVEDLHLTLVAAHDELAVVSV
jgi:hypothetical protein